MSIIFGLPVLAPFTSSTSLLTNNSPIIRICVWKWNSSNKNLGVATNAGMYSPRKGCLFVPSQLTVSELQTEPMWNTDKDEKDEYSEDWDFHWSQCGLYCKSLTQSVWDHKSLPLSNIMLLPKREYLLSKNNTCSKCVVMENKNCNCDDNPDPDMVLEKCSGPIAVVNDGRYFSLEHQKLFKLSSVTKADQSDGAISSLGQYLVMFSESRYSIVCIYTNTYTDQIQNPENITCHLSNPLLNDIEKKDRLVLHRFAMTSGYFDCCPRPWDSIIMAIDKSSGYLAYQVSLPAKNCWIVVGSTRSYSTGDLQYFNKEASFYVLPNAHSGDLEVWKFQKDISSKESEINATFMDEPHANFHHIHAYLVESLKGDLLLVRRYVVIQEDYINGSCNNNFFRTDSFQVFKFSFELKQWELVPSLVNDEAIFVGANNSFSVSCTKHPHVIPNCIYFTDELCHHGGHMLHGKDNGIFHLQDGAFTTLFDPEFKCTQPPIWVCHEEKWWTKTLDECGYVKP